MQAKQQCNTKDCLHLALESVQISYQVIERGNPGCEKDIFLFYLYNETYYGC